MRRIRSESWTFIWHPNVLMQAVFAVPPGATTSSRTRRDGFLDSKTGVTGAAPFVVPLAFIPATSAPLMLLILFLRFVHAGPNDDLPGALFDHQPRKLQVARTGRPAKDGPDLRELALADREDRPFASPSSPDESRNT